MSAKTIKDVHSILMRAKHGVEAIGASAPEVTERDGELRCPVCGGVSEEWGELDYADRINFGDYADSMLLMSESEPDFEHLAYACGMCDALVRIPRSVTVRW